MNGFLFEPIVLPFTVAIGIVLVLFVLEAVGLGLSGLSPDIPDLHAGDHDVDHVGPLDWLGVGRVPVFVVIVTFLAIFGIGGLMLQNFTGGLFTAGVASLIMLVPSLTLTGVLSRLLARILPKDETDAVSLDDLIWKRATVLLGNATHLNPARARVTDSRGTTHHVMVEPDDEVTIFREGDTVQITRREGDRFYAIATESEFRAI